MPLTTQCKGCRIYFETPTLQIPEDYFCEECRYTYGDYLMLTAPIFVEIPEETIWN